jgi:hypothetical protein
MQRQAVGPFNLLLSAVLLAGCTGTMEDVGAVSSELSQPGDETILEWNEIAVDAVGSSPPFPSTRFMATTQLAVFEAVNAITGDYEPYHGTITAPHGASPEAAAITAAHGVLRAFFPEQTATLDQKRADSLASISDGEAKIDGIAVGEAAAAAMIANRAGDGSAPPQFFVSPNTDPGTWQPTPSCSPAGGAFLHWRNVRPFGVESSSQFRADPPPALTSKRWARAYNEVERLGDAARSDRPQDRADVARVYAAQPMHQGWNSMARQLAAARHDSIARTARTFAMLNLSLSDGQITVFESKYFYTTWRPETAIRRGAEDGNDRTEPSPAYVPFVVTPCFPGYPSAHGSGAGAGSRVLGNAYGWGGHDLVSSTPVVPGVVLHYTNLHQIVQDVSDARVYGGIHFRFDQDAAEKLGSEVARHNLQHVLQRVHDHDCDHGD